MSQLAYKYALKKTGLDHALKFGGEEGRDPYKETIPEDELRFWQRKGKTRMRSVPTYLSKHDKKVLKSVKKRAYYLDQSLSVLGIRLGWGGIVGLVPAFGDFVNLFFSVMLIKKSGEIEGGLPESVYTKMVLNVLIDFLVGLIPVVGDFVNIAYKANTRNFLQLEKFLVNKYQAAAVSSVNRQVAEQEKITEIRDDAVPASSGVNAHTSPPALPSRTLTPATTVHPDDSEFPGAFPPQKPALPPRSNSAASSGATQYDGRVPQAHQKY
ncbi:unnamed protein product [Ambrosiozyma monospora]|uniref:Unnamed protein product n=1 Tax=Ambrosiozyma monospora TaxID=43982 RepID=A0ACB5T1U8_AMBMO|nr:unnamed protein product [Ambrosiozyma monospora]